LFEVVKYSIETISTVLGENAYLTTNSKHFWEQMSFFRKTNFCEGSSCFIM